MPWQRKTTRNTLQNLNPGVGWPGICEMIFIETTSKYFNLAEANPLATFDL